MPMASYGNTNFACIPTESIDFPKEPRKKIVPGLVTMAQGDFFKPMIWNVKTRKWKIIKNCLKPEWVKNYVTKVFTDPMKINGIRFWRK
jgi:hypothetical protein